MWLSTAAGCTDDAVPLLEVSVRCAPAPVGISHCDCSVEYSALDGTYVGGRLDDRVNCRFTAEVQGDTKVHARWSLTYSSTRRMRPTTMSWDETKIGGPGDMLTFSP